MVTVIIPVYNGIKTLQKCVDSVISQTYSDLEIILINDGSTDSSESLCDTFPEKDSRIRVLHVKNEGVSSARNNGIKNAKGEYITFVDADDYVEPEYVEKLVSAIEKEGCILASCNSYDVKGDRVTKRDLPGEEKCSIKEYIDNTFYCRAEGGTCWGKLFRTEKIGELFREYNYCEDIFFVFDYLIGREGYVSVIPDYLYHYVRRENSITGLKRTEDLKDVILSCEGIVGICNEKYPGFVDSANALLVNNAFFVYLNAKDETSEEGILLKEMAVNDIKKYRGAVLRDRKATVKTKTACRISYISLKLLKGIYRII
ncbi:MAG: glycosyltransferase family 2 protein [Lachnospiraceae bacterium]|nr:glycosyltransferase family 2 protein [Lachnospiraceae bacterium]